MSKIDCKSLSFENLSNLIVEGGFPSFRSQQINGWLCKGVTDFESMNNIPKDLKAFLQDGFYIPTAKTVEVHRSKIDETEKFLFELYDGEMIESVLMKYKHGWSQCISTQVGCKMGCTFCATGMDGFTRNLSAAEMLAQIETAQKESDVKVSSTVLMGMGEPLDNLENVLEFFNLIFASEFVKIGVRRITLSTCGLVDKIYELMEKKLGITLSVSLHAPSDHIRKITMPVAHKWSMDELIAACGEYASVTGRRVSFEYALIDGVNDSEDCARELASRLRGILCHVNLIPLNSIESENKMSASSNNKIRAFYDIMNRENIPVTIRRTLGLDIDASCGQLRQRNKNSSI